MVQACWGGVFGLLGEQGAGVISSKEGTSLCMTRKERTSMHDKVQRLLSLAKEHNRSTAPQNVAAISPPTKQTII